MEARESPGASRPQVRAVHAPEGCCPRPAGSPGARRQTRGGGGAEEPGRGPGDSRVAAEGGGALAAKLLLPRGGHTDCFSVPRRPGHHMARVLVAKMLACALSPLLRGSPGPAKPRALSTLLAGPLRTAGPAGPWPLPGRLLPGLQLALGFKTKDVIKERCRDCYRVKRRGRWFIYCKTNPKHKQRQM